MFFELLQDTVISKTASLTGEEVATLDKGAIGRQVGTEGDNWLELAFFNQFSLPLQGWVRKQGDDGQARLKEVQAPPVPDISEFAFVKACVDAEYWINKSDSEDNFTFFVTADYLLAWANIETHNKITRWINENSKPTDGTGPYQLSTAEWQAFLASPFGDGYADINREVALDQIAGAAFTARQAMIDISEGIKTHDAAIGHQDEAKKIEPYIPSYVDVLLAHFFGADMAIKFRTSKMLDQGGLKVTAILAQKYSEADVKEFVADRSDFLKDANTEEVETIEGMYLNAQAILGKAFKKAFSQIKKFAPEDATVKPKPGDAPWMSIAETQQVEWEQSLKSETTASGKARVLEYFAKIAFPTNPSNPVPHWCGAFAAFCVKSSPAPASKLVVKGPARAANWVSFGNQSIPLGDPTPPKGAVVVLSPDRNSSSSGHVGFFSHYSGADDQQVFLLGGNQSNTVNVTKFARSKIRVIRWENDEKAQEEAGAPPDGEHATGQFAPLLDFIGAHESNNNYNAYYAHAGNTNNPRLTNKNIRQVFAFQSGLRLTASGKYQFLKGTLRGLVNTGKIGLNDLFDQAHQDQLAIDLMIGRGLNRYLAGKISTQQFGLNLAKEWASMPVPFNTQGQQRPVKAGESYYASDGLNKSLVSVGPFLAAIEKIKPA